nr:histidine triad nucleotide-binding protein [Maliibacterium massiliense]
MEDCLFCKIIAGEIPAKRAYEDEQVVVIHDINPQAPMHMLVLPKKHLASIAQMAPEDKALLGHMMFVAQQMAKAAGIADAGFRLVINTGKDGAQSVQHLHLHVLGGRALSGQMG